MELVRSWTRPSASFVRRGPVGNGGGWRQWCWGGGRAPVLLVAREVRGCIRGVALELGLFGPNTWTSQRLAMDSSCGWRPPSLVPSAPPALLFPASTHWPHVTASSLSSLSPLPVLFNSRCPTKPRLGMATRRRAGPHRHEVVDPGDRIDPGRAEVAGQVQQQQQRRGRRPHVLLTVRPTRWHSCWRIVGGTVEALLLGRR